MTGGSGLDQFGFGEGETSALARLGRCDHRLQPCPGRPHQGQPDRRQHRARGRPEVRLPAATARSPGWPGSCTTCRTPAAPSSRATPTATGWPTSRSGWSGWSTSWAPTSCSEPHHPARRTCRQRPRLANHDTGAITESGRRTGADHVRRARSLTTLLHPEPTKRISIIGLDGDDTLSGGGEADLIRRRWWRRRALRPTVGNDTSRPERRRPGNDTLIGGAPAMTICAVAGLDHLDGGAGADTFSCRRRGNRRSVKSTTVGKAPTRCRLGRQRRGHLRCSS